MARPFVLPLLLTTALSLAAAPQAGAPAAPRHTADPILDLLEQAQKSGKGVLVHVGAHAIGGAVVKVGDGTVELRSREYARILIRLERIDAVSGN